MNEILNDAVKYIDQSEKGLMISKGEDDKFHLISINVFSTSFTGIYFIVKRNSGDIYSIKLHSKSTFHFQNNLQDNNGFKNILLEGEVRKLLYENELYNAVRVLANKYPFIKNTDINKLLKQYTVYSVKADLVRLCDYTRIPVKMKEIIYC